MDITITSVNHGDYINIKSLGVLDGQEELNKHAVLVYEEAKKFDNHKALVDCTGTRFPLDVFSYYDQVQFFSKNLPSDIRSYKVAVVTSPEYEEIGKFWETVSVNRGYNYHAFISMEKAGRWLINNL